MKRIAIQGELGSFHDIAAHQYFNGEQIQLICCKTFEQVFENVKRDPTAIAMLAIENTIAGSLLHNYDLLRQSGTTVVESISCTSNIASAVCRKMTGPLCRKSTPIP